MTYQGRAKVVVPKVNEARPLHQHALQLELVPEGDHVEEAAPHGELLRGQLELLLAGVVGAGALSRRERMIEV